MTANTHTFGVVYELNGKEKTVEITIDVGDWTEEDFQGNEGQDYLEEKLLEMYPDAELCWVECPDTLDE